MGALRALSRSVHRVFLHAQSENKCEFWSDGNSILNRRSMAAHAHLRLDT